ncbi:unnamed protein product [Rotaria sordida]|uniref:Uncharacterized protein n=1 Tax=Rotaria sordida TaxID=392033 RepID=A0A815UWL2_9BILA|nr:unnamed protein product [Rotaria sordida]CAF1229099.1 unnamed protein product [Rotaria sordida]CAF1237466.1 unnamed protein product [Rotaria sordida]CAF1315474.1 unnamed protein product [Rotaria sordida]CAF1519653.1 unnamed protein product [Rotaria sordida]
MAKLNFDRVKESPRLCIKSNMDDDYGAICSNDEYFIIYCQSSGFTLIDKEGHEQKLNTKHDFPVIGIRWSSYLQKFLVLSGDNDHKLYLLDPIKQKLKMIKNFGENRPTDVWTCYEKTLLIVTQRSYRLIEMYRLPSLSTTDDDELIIKSLEQPIEILTPSIVWGKIDQIRELCFSHDGKYLALVSYYLDDSAGRPEEEDWLQLFAFQHDGEGNKILKRHTYPTLTAGSCVLALPEEKYLTNNAYSRKHLLILVDYSETAEPNNIDESDPSDRQKWFVKETDYDTQNTVSEISICGNCLAIKTSDKEICFYDL